MPEITPSGVTPPESPAVPAPPARVARGVLAGGAALLASMLTLAVMAAALGWIRRPEAGPVQLGSWLTLQLTGGAFASMLAGWIARRVARHERGPAILAGLVLIVGLLEAIEILRYMRAGTVEGPAALVVLAPFVAAAGVRLGGRWRFVAHRASGDHLRGHAGEPD